MTVYIKASCFTCSLFINLLRVSIAFDCLLRSIEMSIPKPDPRLSVVIANEILTSPSSQRLIHQDQQVDYYILYMSYRYQCSCQKDFITRACNILPTRRISLGDIKLSIVISASHTHNMSHKSITGRRNVGLSAFDAEPAARVDEQSPGRWWRSRGRLQDSRRAAYATGPDAMQQHQFRGRPRLSQHRQ